MRHTETGEEIIAANDDRSQALAAAAGFVPVDVPVAEPKPKRKAR